MKILFDLNHPAHVHLFKNFIFYLKKQGHYVFVVSRDKDITQRLLNYYRIEHKVLTKPHTTYLGMLKELAIRDISLFKSNIQVKGFDFAFGTSVSIAHLSALTKVKSYAFIDNDDNFIIPYKVLTYPFVTGIVHPRSLKYKGYDTKRIFHDSFHELSYLHPNNFKPDIGVLKKYNLEEKKYIIVRLCAHNAYHDAGVKGISKELFNQINKSFKYLKIIKSVENDLNSQIDPWDMHHVLAYSKMIISDSATMSNEAGVLGVPAVCIASWVDKLSVIKSYSDFGLIKTFKPNEKQIVSEIFKLLRDPSLQVNWDSRRLKMLSKKIDLNRWMIDFFEKIS